MPADESNLALYLLHDPSDGRDEQQESALGILRGLHAPPLLWAGLIPGQEAAARLEAVGAAATSHDDAAATHDGDDAPEVDDPGAAVFGAPWPVARKAYLDRLEAFCADHPGLRSHAQAFIDRLDAWVDEAVADELISSAAVVEVTIEIDLLSWQESYGDREAYVESFGGYLASWMWPG